MVRSWIYGKSNTQQVNCLYSYSSRTNSKFMQLVDLQILCRCKQAIKQEKVYTEGKLKLTHINFTINYQKHFLCGKTEKLKITVLVFFKQENCYHKMTSIRKSYISKSVKKLKTITCWTVWKYLGKNPKESYYHLYQQTVLLKMICIYDFRVEIFIKRKWKIFWLQKIFTQILWIFCYNKCILVRLWVNVFVSQRMGTSRN